MPPIPPTLTASEAFAAGCKLGVAVRKVRGGPKSLAHDIQRYVTSRYLYYETYDAICRGFAQGYNQVIPDIEENNFRGL